MANHKSAEKRIRQTKVRTERNKSHLSRLRTAFKKIEDAIAGKDKSNATTTFEAMQSYIMKSESHGIIHKNTIARKLSRFSARIKVLS